MRKTIVLTDPGDIAGVDWRKWRQQVIDESSVHIMLGHDVSFDVSAINHPTSSELSLLCSIYAMAQTRGRDVYLERTNEHWRNALSVSRIDRLLRYA